MHIFTELLGAAHLREVTSILGKPLAVSYLRFSSADQADTDYDSDGLSIKAQREANQRKADELDAIIVAEFVDRAESAKSADRHDLQRMLRLLAECGGNIRYAIVHKVDRLACNRADDVAITMAIQKAGAQLVSATENIDDAPQGRLLHGVMATIAEYHIANLATETKKGTRQKVKGGGSPGMAPLGYLNSRERFEDREIRVVIVDPVRGPLVKWGLEAYATGEWTMLTLRDEQRDRLASLETERTKLLRLHLVDDTAVPVDLLKREQARISDEMRDAQKLIDECSLAHGRSNNLSKTPSAWWPTLTRSTWPHPSTCAASSTKPCSRPSWSWTRRSPRHH